MWYTFIMLMSMVYHKLPSAEELKILYDSGISLNEIAEQFGSSINGVSLKLRRAGYKNRNLHESQILNSNHLIITPHLTDFIDGLLLGDGCISLSPTGYSAAYTHTDKNYEYLIWLKEKLCLFNMDSIIREHSKKNCFMLRTRYYSELVDFRTKWYPNNKKLVPVDFIISPTKMFHWYIGDGNYRPGSNKTKHGRVFRIAMYFDPEGCERIRKMLSEVKIETTYKGFALMIRSESIPTFFNYMQSSGLDVPVSYKYKFPMGVV